MMDSEKSIASMVSLALLGSLIGSGSTFLLNILVGRIGGADTLGIFSLGTVIIGIGGLIGRAGLDHAVLKFVPDSNDDKDVDIPRYALIVSTLIGMSLTVVFLFIYPLLIQYYSFPNNIGLYIFAIGIPLHSTVWICIKTSQLSKNTKYTVYIRDLGKSLSALLLVGSLSFWISADLAIAVGYVISLAISLFVGFVYLKKLKLLRFNSLNIDHRIIKKMLVYSLPVMISSASHYIVSWTDIIVLSSLVSSKNVGFYQAAFQISAILTLILNASKSIFPTLASTYYSQGKMDLLNQTYGSVTKWVFYFTSVGFIYILFNPEFILQILFGNEFSVVANALVILGFGQLVAAITGPVGYLLIMSDFERIDLFNNLFIAIVNLVANYILILQYGVVGAAIATAGSLIFLNLIRQVQVYHYLNIRPDISSYFAMIVLLFIPSLSLLTNFFFSNIVVLIIYGFVASMSPIVYLYIWGIPEEDMVLFENL